MSLIRTIVLLICPLALLLPNNVYSQGDVTFVNNDFFSRPQRPSSVFHHDTHNEQAEIYECSVCHHIYDEEGQKVEDESSEDESCTFCHLDGSKAGELDLRRRFHIACNTCHKEKKKGPVSCGHCHLKIKK